MLWSVVYPTKLDSRREFLKQIDLLMVIDLQRSRFKELLLNIGCPTSLQYQLSTLCIEALRNVIRFCLIACFVFYFVFLSFNNIRYRYIDGIYCSSVCHNSNILTLLQQYRPYIALSSLKGTSINNYEIRNL